MGASAVACLLPGGCVSAEREFWGNQWPLQHWAGPVQRARVNAQTNNAGAGRVCRIGETAWSGESIGAVF